VRRFPFLAVIIAAALIAAVFLIFERTPEKPADLDGSETPRKEMHPKAAEEKTPEPEGESKPSRSGHAGRSIAIIIDDIGFDLKIVEELAGIPAPIAFAVLPHTPHAVESAGRLHAAGKDILLHLPMEPRSYPGESPGAGALMADMGEGEIRKLVRENLAAVPFVAGVNNHMGSRFMEDETRLAIVMDVLRSKGLFFVDSMTDTDSRGRKSAGTAGVRFAARDVFIDHTPGYAAALEKLTESLRRKGRNGEPVLMIGHPHAETVRAIRNALRFWETEGVRVIPVSACLRIPPERETRERNDPRTQAER
jgi:uncharacterized protein